MRRLGLTLALLSLAGCATAPEPPKPSVAASGPFVTRPAGADPALEPATAWWRLYEDPVLDRLVAEAFAANTDLRIAEANLRRARAIWSETRANWLPSTEISGGTTYGDAPGQNGQSAGRRWTTDASAGLSWEVDLFGRLASAMRAARADTQAVEAARDGVRVAVAAETTRAYSDACAFGEAVEVARSSLKMTEESLSIITRQERAGAASRLDVDRAATAVARAKAALPPLEDQKRAAVFELAALLGRPPSQAPAEALACVRPPSPVAALPVGDGAGLLRRRPDVREAERRLAADTARIGVATADLYPRISLGGSVDYLDGDATPKRDEITFSVGPLISWSFPNITKARARIRQARAGADASLAAFDGTVLTALKETEQALSTYGAEGERQVALITARDRAEHAFQLAQDSYRAGSLSYLDVLVAQRELLDASSELAGARQRLGAARVRLFKALGGGWSTS
jgi:NodT family efflux transporter outer membrane factor (OMF) lipoprotein